MRNAIKDRRDIIEVCINLGIARKGRETIYRHWLQKPHKNMTAREFAESHPLAQPKISSEETVQPEIIIEEATVETVENVSEENGEPEVIISSQSIKTDETLPESKTTTWPED